MFLIIFIALVGIYFLLKQPVSNTEQSVLKLFKNQDSIDKIEITQNNQINILIKEDGIWWVGKQGINLPIDVASINSLMADLSQEMKLEKVSSNPEKYNVYELSDDKLTNLKIYKGNKLVKELNIGKIGTIYPSSYIRLSNDALVYQVNNNLSYSARKNDWIKKEILGDLDIANVKKITWKRYSGEISIMKDEDHWKMTQPESISLEDTKVNEIINSLSSLRINNYITDDSIDKGSLVNSSILTLNIEMEQGEARVSFFNVDDKYYVMQGNGLIAVLSESEFNKADKELENFIR